MRVGTLNGDRIPATLDEARAMVAYNERTLLHSRSAQRRYRAERMLANLRPHLARLEADARDRERLARRSTSRVVRDRDDEFEIVWDGSVR